MNSLQTLVKNLADKHGRSRESLLPILEGVVEKERYLSEYSMIEIAKELDLSAADVFGTASFYSFLETKKMGKNIIRICKTIACSMKGTNQIVMVLEDALKIKMGETTADGMFTLLHTNCLGWCHKGPAMLINDEVFTDLTPEKVKEIIAEFIKENN